MTRESFEIYYFQDKRWSVHASFESTEREKALAEAQELEKAMRVPIRLVRELYDSETNTSENSISWQSAKAKEMPDADDMFGIKAKAAPKKKDKPKPAPPPPRRKDPEPEAPAPAPKAARPAAKKRKRKKTGKRGVAAKLAIVVSMSLAMAVLVAIATSLGIVGLQKMKVIAAADRRATVAGMFVVAYALSALYQLIRQFELYKQWNFSFFRRRPRKEKAPSASDMIRKMNVAAQEATGTPPDAPIEDGAPAADMDIEDLRAEVEQQDAEVEGDRLGEDEFTTEVQASEEMPPDMQTEMPAPVEPPQPVAEPAQPQAPPPPAPEPVKAAAPPPPKSEAKPEPPKVEKPPEKPPAEAEAHRIFMGFVGDAVKVANGVQSPLNAFSRFGLNLYLSGACSTLGQSRKLARTPQLTLLRDGLQAAGLPRERAESFCAELPSHGKNPRYAGMIQAGGAAMSRQLTGQGGAISDLTGLLNEWGKPEKRAAVPREFTFLFTDLVGSTALTSQLGNAAAQKVVRAHNTAVRGAIQAFGGREVKHTGDGIMATFPTPLAGVQATIRMQKELVATATANPALNFSVRMGLNVGEAVEEDNDYFGGAVQMAARICAAATERNIWVSKSVVDACKGQRIGFIPRGAFSMKGIQQARPLYEVAYTDAHRNELSNL